MRLHTLGRTWQHPEVQLPLHMGAALFDDAMQSAGHWDVLDRLGAQAWWLLLWLLLSLMIW